MKRYLMSERIRKNIAIVMCLCVAIASYEASQWQRGATQFLIAMITGGQVEMVVVPLVVLAPAAGLLVLRSGRSARYYYRLTHLPTVILMFETFVTLSLCPLRVIDIVPTERHYLSLVSTALLLTSMVVYGILLQVYGRYQIMQGTGSYDRQQEVLQGASLLTMITMVAAFMCHLACFTDRVFRVIWRMTATSTPQPDTDISRAINNLGRGIGTLALAGGFLTLAGAAGIFAGWYALYGRRRLRWVAVHALLVVYVGALSALGYQHAQLPQAVGFVSMTVVVMLYVMYLVLLELSFALAYYRRKKFQRE